MVRSWGGVRLLARSPWAGGGVNAEGPGGKAWFWPPAPCGGRPRSHSPLEALRWRRRQRREQSAHLPTTDSAPLPARAAGALTAGVPAAPGLGTRRPGPCSRPSSQPQPGPRLHAPKPPTRWELLGSP